VLDPGRLRKLYLRERHLPAPTCSDNVKNGDETDVDCGGSSCTQCAVGRLCATGSDCQTGSCSAGRCQQATCTDMIENGAETDVDCGGPTSCPRCGTAKGCTASSDCNNAICSNGQCQALSCTDGVRNGTETDIDCGGVSCAKCAAGATCQQGPDCQSGSCSVICQSAPCTATASCQCQFYGGHTYRFCNASTGWLNAQSACKATSMRMVRIDSVAEESWLFSVAVNIASSGWWIGANDRQLEGKWVWDDGTQFWSGGVRGTAVSGRYSHWDTSEPNNVNGSEDCAMVSSINGWWDVPCTDPKAYICEGY